MHHLYFVIAIVSPSSRPSRHWPSVHLDRLPLLFLSVSRGGDVAPCSLAVRSMRRGRRSRTFTNFPAAAPGAVVDADERGGRGGRLTVSGGGFMGRWAVVTGKQLFQVRNFAEREMIIQGESGWSHRGCRSQISRPRLRAPPWKTCGGDRGGRSAVSGGEGRGGDFTGRGTTVTGERLCKDRGNSKQSLSISKIKRPPTRALQPMKQSTDSKACHKI